MNQSADPSTLALAERNAARDANRGAYALFWAALRQSPLRIGFGLILEYAMFASGVFLALGLFATRVPLRLVDRAFGLRLRERFIELIARVSPG